VEGGECHKHCRRSKINLVDLAGSERLSHSCTSGERLRVSEFLKLTELKTSFRWNMELSVVFMKAMKALFFFNMFCILIHHTV
jgi:hypothetical protein